MALGLERSSIPLVTGPDYKPQPVMANLPDQKPDDIQLVSFEPDAPAEAPAPAKAPGGNFITDAARVIGMGALGLGQMAGNLAYAGTNSSGLKTVADKLGEWSSDLHSGLTPGMKAAEEKKFINDDGTRGDAWSDPKSWLFQIYNQVGSTLPMIGAGRFIGIGAEALAGVSKLKPAINVANVAGEAATSAAIKGGAEVAAATEIGKDAARSTFTTEAAKLGVANASLDKTMAKIYGANFVGQTAAGTYLHGSDAANAAMESIAPMTDAQLSDSPEYVAAKQKYLGAGASDTEAQDQAKEDVRRAAGLTAARVTASAALPFQLLMSHVNTKLFTGGMGQGSRLANFGMAAAQEVPANALELGTVAYGGNIGVREHADATRDPWHDVANTAVGAGIGALGMAGAHLFVKPPGPGTPLGAGATPPSALSGDYLPAGPGPTGISAPPSAGQTYDQAQPALPPGQLMLPAPPDPAIEGEQALALPAPADGGPSDRQMEVSRGLLNHSPRPSAQLLQRLMNVDPTMAGMLYGHWKARNEDTQSTPAAASVSTSGDQNGNQTDQAVQGQPQAPAQEAPAVTPLDVQAHAAATSPYNATPQPTDGQKEAGNYRLGHVTVQGLQISIENPSGSVRSGTDANGKPWQNTMANHYGYLKGTVGSDKDHLDVFLGPQAETAPTAYVIDQINPGTGAFDEHKIVLGATSPQDASDIYHANYQDGWKGMGAITAMPMPEFKDWIKSGDTKKPLAPNPAPAPVADPLQAQYAEAQAAGDTNEMRRLAPMINQAKAQKPVQPKAPAAVAPGTGFGKVGLMPNTAQPVSLHDHGDGTATIMRGDEPFYDFENGDPIKVSADATPEMVRKAVSDAQAITSKEKWFGVKAEQAAPAPKATTEKSSAVAPAVPEISQPEAVTYPEHLKTAGLSVATDTTKTGKAVWNVSGNTQPHKDMLKALGGRWYGPKKVWSFNADPNSKIADKLSSIAGKPTAEMSEPMLKQIAASSQPAAEKANSEIERRAEKKPVTPQIKESAADSAKNVAPAQKERFEYPNPKYAEPAAELPMRAVVDYMNGDITRDTMTKVIVDSGLLQGTIRSITNRLGDDSYSNAEIAEINRRQEGSKAQQAPSAREDDLSSIFDAALDDAFKETPKPEPKPAEKIAGAPVNKISDKMIDDIAKSSQPAAEKAQREQVRRKTATESGKSAAGNAGMGMADVAKGLNALFKPKPGQLNMGLGFDEDTYAAAKPYFQAGIAHFKQAGTDIAEMVKSLIVTLRDKFGMDRATIENMKPYVMRFMEDVKAGKIGYDGKTEVANDSGTEGQGGRILEGMAPAEVGRSGRRGPSGRGADAGGDASGARDTGADGTRGETGRGGRDRPAADDTAATGSGSVGAGTGDRRGTGAEGSGLPEGNGQRAKGSDGSDVHSPASNPLADFVIGEDVALGSGGQMTKYRDNVAAIKLLKTLEAELRRATPAEQRTLARYVGWGGIPNAFQNVITKEVKADWEKEVAELAGLMTPKELRNAAASTRNAHYTAQPVVDFMWRAAQRMGFNGGLVLEPSVGTGNFIGLMPEGLRANTHVTGIELDSLTARIAGALYPRSNIVQSGFDKLPLPDDQFDLAIGNPPFGSESLRFAFKPELNGASIHNQFFRASMDAVRPGGLQVMVVSRFLMDAQNSNNRVALAKQAKLLGAVRLPGSAFKGNALTEAVTDILFLQRRTAAEESDIQGAFHERGKKVPANEDAGVKASRLRRAELLDEAMRWIETASIKDPLGGEPMVVNRYFNENPNMIAGTMDRSGSMRQNGDIEVKLAKGESLQEAMDARMRFLPGMVAPTRSAEIEARTLEAHKFLGESLALYATGAEVGAIRFEPDGSLSNVVERVGEDGQSAITKIVLNERTPWSPQLAMNLEGKWYRIVTKLDLTGKPVKAVKDGKLTKRNVYEREVFEKESDVPDTLRMGKSVLERMKKLIAIRDLLVEQINLEVNSASNAAMEGNRTKLRGAYEGFVKDHGFISEQNNANVVSEMPDEGLLLSLENNFKREVTAAKAKSTGMKQSKAKAEQAAILSRPVGIPPTRQDHADTIGDALAIAMSETGRLDLDRIEQLRGIPRDDVEKELTGGDTPLAFPDPEVGYALVDKNAYLSGNVRRKLEAARTAKLEKNIAALEAIQPKAWTSDQVTPKMGATWIPSQVFADFVNHLLGEETKAKVTFARATNTFQVFAGGNSAAATSKWGTKRMPAPELITAMLNSRKVAVFDAADRDGGPCFNQTETDAALDKRREVFEAFDNWIFKDADRRRALTQIFNDEYNVRVNRQHDGSHMQFPGKVPDDIIKFRRGQINAIWRGVVENFVLYDHAVGAGKTFTGISRAMERRRMGLSKKPMVVVPNHLVKEWQIQTYRLYPGAKVLAAGKNDLSTKNRRRLFAKIATGDWDLVIIPHSSFGLIELSPETAERFLTSQLELAESALKEAEAQQEPGSRFKSLGVKAAEALVKKISDRIDAVRNKKRDRLITFEQMGIDDLTCDESHEFKNLMYSSNLTDVRGMGNAGGSQKALDMYMKVKLLHENNGSVAYMTGTPISNSAVEMYSILRYLAPDVLNEMELEHFDAFRTNFVEATAKFEPTDSGSGLKLVTRLGREWSNMRALMDAYYSVADVVTNDDIKAWYAEDNPGNEFPLPKVKGGNRQAIAVEPTPTQLRLLNEIIAGFEALPGMDDVKERNAERLRLMDRARKVSLHGRALDPMVTDEAGGKLDRAVQEIKRIYDAWQADKGTQLVFLDRGVPKAKGDSAILKAYDTALAAQTKAEKSGDEHAYAKANERLDAFDANEMQSLRDAQSNPWNGYQHIKDGLVAKGIPANEIAFIQNYNSDADKEALFNAVRDGTVRVLIGSTPRMGAGTNVQERLVALHHIDATWKPSDIEQREGRIIRQGNHLLEKYGSKFEPEILAYVTERTVDAKLWSLNSMKLRMINAIRHYDGSFEMEFEDSDSVGMAEIAAIASGDPLLLERFKLTAEVDGLYRQMRSFQRRMDATTDALSRAKRDRDQGPEQLQKSIERGDAAREVLDAVKADAAKRAITIMGKEYDSRSAAQWAASQEVVKQKGDDEKGAISVNIDGKEYTSKGAVEEAVSMKMGDEEPFVAEVDGKQIIRRSDFARAMRDAIGAEWQALPDEKPVGSISGIPVTISTRASTFGNYVGLQGFLKTENRRERIFDERDITPEKHTKGTPIPVTVTGLRPIVTHFEDGIARLANNKYEIEEIEKRIASADRDIPTLEGQFDDKFKGAEELAEKTERLRVVEAELEGRAKATPAAADTKPADYSKYHFRKVGEVAQVVLKAVPVEINGAQGLTFYAYQDEKKQWHVNEGNTGLALAHAGTKKEAIKSAQDTFDRMGIDKIRAATDGKEITDEQKGAAVAEASKGADGAPAYSRATGAGMSPFDVEKAVKEAAKGMKNAPPIEVVQSAADLPFDAPSDANGAYVDGKVWFVADNLASAEDARDTLRHEVIGHFGLRGFFGKALDAVLTEIHRNNLRVQVAALKWKNANKKLIEEWKAEYRMTDEDVRYRSIEEALSEMAERGEKQTFWKGLAAAIQKALRAMGLEKLANTLEAKTDAEALDALKKAEMFVRNGITEEAESAIAGQAPLFSRPHISGDSGRTYTPEQKKAFSNVGREETTPTLKERVASMWKNIGKKMEQGMADQFAPLKDLGGDAYLLSRMSRAADGALEALLMYGKLFLRDGVYDVNVKDGGVIDKLLRPLGAEADDFMWWVAGNRADSLTKESAATRAEGARLLNQAGVMTWNAREFEKKARDLFQQAGNFSKTMMGNQRAQKANAQQADEWLREAKRLNKSAAEFRARGNAMKDVSRENLMTADDIAALKDLNKGQLDFDYKLPNGKTTRDRAEAYRAAQDIFSGFNKSVLDIAEESGLIDGDDRKIWERDFYVPFYREMDGDKKTFPSVKSGLVRQKAFDRLKGGSEKLNSDLLANTILNWSHMISAASKNRAARSALTEAEKIGAAEWVPTAEKDSVSFKEDGADMHYQVSDPFILNAITALEFAGFSGQAMQVMGAFKRWITMGVTANPAFKIRNLIRDSLQAVGTAEMSYNVLKNLKEGYQSTSKESQTYASMLASGGHIRFGTMIEGNRADHVRRLVEEGVDPGTILDSESKLKAVWKRHVMPLVDAYNELGDRSENINRAAIYDQLRAKGASHAEASYQARDLMDFSMGGTFVSVRFLTQTVPFTNARIQGLYKLGRAAKENPKRFGYVVGAVALASLALLGAYHDDDDWKKREDWDRDTYWWFKVGGLAFRIPKPFEIGSIGTLAERTAELLWEKEMDGHRFGQRLQSMISNTFSMTLLPQMFKPIYEVGANMDSFTNRPIESMGMEKMRPEDRFNERSSEIAKALGKPGILSPLQIDHLIRGYFGWLGTAAVTSVDALVHSLDDKVRPTMQLRDAFLAGSFVETLPSGSSRYVTEMYQQAKGIDEAYNSWRHYLKSGDKASADAVFAEDKDKIMQYKTVERIKRAETAANEQVQRIGNNPGMTADEKRTALDNLSAAKDRFSRSISATGLQKSAPAN